MSVKSVPDLQSTPLLRLYVAGDTPGARRALESRLQVIEALHGKLDIEIVDILEQPDEAEKAGILATPTLSDESVDPPRRLVGDIGNIAQVLEYFGYRKKDSTQ
jgi:circadian clock protein KaiB